MASGSLLLFASALLASANALSLPRVTPPNMQLGEWIARALGKDFKPCRTMFIAALGDPSASSGTGAADWGLWRIDPGPPGVYLKDYDAQIAKRDGVAPAGWRFDSQDYWIEEYGRIMEAPEFPIPPGSYIVTGDREVTTELKIDESGGWQLAEGTLYDVTHLPCRSARYRGSSPAKAKLSDFPVTPGGKMPAIEGATHQDYAVLFVVAVPMDWQ